MNRRTAPKLAALFDAEQEEWEHADFGAYAAREAVAPTQPEGLAELGLAYGLVRGMKRLPSRPHPRRAASKRPPSPPKPPVKAPPPTTTAPPVKTPPTTTAPPVKTPPTTAVPPEPAPPTKAARLPKAAKAPTGAPPKGAAARQAAVPPKAVAARETGPRQARPPAPRGTKPVKTRPETAPRPAPAVPAKPAVPGGDSTKVTQSVEQAIREEMAKEQARALRKGGVPRHPAWVGPSGEAAAGATLRLKGHQVADVNKLRSNFPAIDISYAGTGAKGSMGGFASVKTYGLGTPGPASPSTLEAYAGDLKSMLKTGGPGYAPVPAEKAAELLAKPANRKLLQDLKAWPRDLRANASKESIAKYINEKGTLMVPDDHVDDLRKFVKQQAMRDPGAYELEPGPNLEADIERLQARIQGMGVTTDQLVEAHQRVTGVP
jgi:hypothetical protein